MVQAYPDPVRVVSVGKAVDALLADPDNKENAANSVEFCGGTHLSNTSDAVDFAIVSESAIAQGAPAPPHTCLLTWGPAHWHGIALAVADHVDRMLHGTC